MAGRTQEERDAVEAKRKAAQERARKRKADAKKKAESKKKDDKKSKDTKSKDKKPFEIPKGLAPTNDIKVTKLPPPRDAEYVSSGRGDGRAEMLRRRLDPVIDKLKKDEKKKKDDKAPENDRMGAADAAPLAAAAGAARRGGPRRPTGTGRPMIGQRPIPFDSGVSRSTEIIPSRNPSGGGMYMLNPGGGPGRLGGPQQRSLRPRLMNKGGMVKANCGASMKPTQGKKK